MAKRKRRAFTKEFKAGAVQLVRESGKSVGAVARELDLTETALRDWVRQAEVDAGHGAWGALTTAEREELGRLRRENRTLQMERDILKFVSPKMPNAAVSGRGERRRARGPLDCDVGLSLCCAPSMQALSAEERLNPTPHIGRPGHPASPHATGSEEHHRLGSAVRLARTPEAASSDRVEAQPLSLPSPV